MTPLVELSNISLQQGRFSLQVSRLELYPGRLYSLEGENGSGKSTLLRVLALLQKPDSGQQSVAGCRVTWKESDLHSFRQQISLLEQNPFLFTGSVEKNLAYGLNIRGIHGRERQERIEQVLAATGLTGFNQRLTAELSGGERRRVALARALVLQPRLLLLDEPTANLDAEQIAALERFLSGLPVKGITVVIANHDRHQPERLGGEIFRLRNGRLEKEESSGNRSARNYPRLQRIGDL